MLKARSFQLGRLGHLRRCGQRQRWQKSRIWHCGNESSNRRFSGNTLQSSELVTLANSSVSVTQTISWFNNRFLYDRRMTVRMDHGAVHDNTRTPKLPKGLRSIGMGFGADGNPLHNVARNVCCWQDIKTLFNRLDDARVTV